MRGDGLAFFIIALIIFSLVTLFYMSTSIIDQNVDDTTEYDNFKLIVTFVGIILGVLFLMLAPIVEFKNGNGKRK